MEQACRVLKISRSGCYGRARHNPCSRKRKNQTLQRRLMEPHQNDLALGLGNLCHLLKPEFGCPRKHVHRQMRLAGIASVKCRACKITTNSRHSHPVAPTLLKRNSFFEQPNQAWGRYYLHSHRRGLALSGHRQGLVYRQKGGLCLFQSYLIPRPPWKRWNRAVRRLRRHERASPRMSRVHSAFPGVLRPFFREGLKDKTLRHFHSCERALKPCSDSF